MEILAGSLLTPDTVNATDYPVQETDRNLIGVRGDFPHVELDQTALGPYGNVSCFYTAAFKCVADTFPITDKQKVIDAWRLGWANIVKDGKVTPGLGGRISDGVDYARRAWNSTFPDKKVRTYRGLMPRFDVESPLHQQFYQAIFNGWMLQFGSFMDSKLSKEASAGEIKDDYAPNANKWGHSRNLYLYENVVGGKGGTVKVSDNYPNLAGFTNHYQMDDLEEKVKNGQVFASYFLALPA